MSRYIDKEQIYTAIDIVRNYCIDNGRCFEVMILEMVMHEISKIPTADVVEVKKGEVLMPITKEELVHLMNDTIAYIWRLEERKCDKEEFGYFSRKELLEKLKQFEKEHFPELDTSPCG